MYSSEDLKKLSSGSQILLDLGCGKRKKPGFIGVDVSKVEGVDIVANLEGGLPFEDNSIDGIYSNFMFEHVADSVKLFKELYRICKPNAIIEFSVPYFQSISQFKDPTHKSFITPDTLPYFSNKNWYGADYNINTNFEVQSLIYKYYPPFNFMVHKYFFFLWPITYPIVLFARRFLWNVVHSIIFKIKVLK